MDLNDVLNKDNVLEFSPIIIIPHGVIDVSFKDKDSNTPFLIFKFPLLHLITIPGLPILAESCTTINPEIVLN
jgi:hypothetical protein